MKKYLAAIALVSLLCSTAKADIVANLFDYYSEAGVSVGDNFTGTNWSSSAA